VTAPILRSDVLAARPRKRRIRYERMVWVNMGSNGTQ
jgi:hypothetical protein